MVNSSGDAIDAKQLQQERIQIYTDFYNNTIPKRLPVQFSVAHHAIAEYSGVDVIEAQFDYSLLAKGAKQMCDLVYSDTCPVGGVGLATRTPAFYQLLDSQSFVMGNKGFIQHPEVIGMTEDEYDALIADPYAALLEIVLPRQHKALGLDNPIRMAKAVHMAIASKAADGAQLAPILGQLVGEYGYYPGPPRGSGGFTAAPYDFLADQLRSFSEISKDIRRNRKKVAEACEALYPMMFKMGLPPNPSPRGAISTPLHMPTYMREKDFVEVWMPTYKRMVEQYAALGARVSAFCEHDWMRYLDILQDLPAGTLLRFEFGDPQLIKDKLGQKFFIGGLYPLDLSKRGTKQECVDKAKEILDIMLPIGGYSFGFDKGALMLSDINFENYNAIAETVRDYAVYENPGASFGMPLNSEGFTFDPKITPDLKSKWLLDWDEFKRKYPYTPESAKSRIMGYDNAMFAFYMNLVV